MRKSQVGKFIAECRRAQNLTQAGLAEKLGITDRAVCKWETGRGTPDSASMLRLCAILKISVNELLSGEKIAMENYNQKAEENLLKLQYEKEKSDRELLRLEMISGYATSIIVLGSTFLITFAEVPTWIKIVLTITILIPVVTIILYLTRIEQIAGFYECQKCHHKYVPKFQNVFFAWHFGRKRRMKCENCGKNSWHKKVLTK